MENQAAKDLWGQPLLSIGSLLELNESAEKKTSFPSWVISNDFVTSVPTRITTEFQPITTDFRGARKILFFNKQNGGDPPLLLYREKRNDDNESLTAMVSTSSNNHETDGGSSNNNNNNKWTFLRRAQRTCGNGLNYWYWYRTTPVVDGQAPSLTVPQYEVDPTAEKPTKDALASAEATTLMVPLYIYARVVPVRKWGDTTHYVVVSVVKGMDHDAHESGAGFLWKDIYKIIKMPQFQYAAIILDIVTTPGGQQQSKLVGKSKQAGSFDARPVFDIAPGVDLLLVLSACIPLFPDGNNVWSGVGEVAEILFGF